MLQWWIPHHLEKFDEAVIIDYESTDNTVEMIRELAPHWKIVKPYSKTFKTIEVDTQVYHIEQIMQSKYPGAAMVALTITEFLIGNTKFLDNVNGHYEKYILMCQMCDTEEQLFTEPDPNLPLTKQRTFGYPEVFNDSIPTKDDLFASHPWNYYVKTAENKYEYNHSPSNVMSLGVGPRFMRCIRNGAYNPYVVGRHYWCDPVEERLKIACYYHSPITKKYIERKAAIQYNLDKGDLDKFGFGYHHVGITEDLVIQRLRYMQQHCEDLTNVFEKLENKI